MKTLGPVHLNLIISHVIRYIWYNVFSTTNKHQPACVETIRQTFGSMFGLTGWGHSKHTHARMNRCSNQEFRTQERRGAAIEDGRNLDDFGGVPRGLPVPDHHHLRGQLLLAGAGARRRGGRHGSVGLCSTARGPADGLLSCPWTTETERKTTGMKDEAVCSTR